MSLVGIFAPVIALFLTISSIGTALPLVQHRFVLQILAFILSGIGCILLLLVTIVMLGDSTVSLYSVNSEGGVKLAVTVPFDKLRFFQLNLTMTSWLAVSVLVMVCWMCHHCRKGWHIYIVPMLHDLNALEEVCWANTIDLRDRVISNVS